MWIDRPPARLGLPPQGLRAVSSMDIGSGPWKGGQDVMRNVMALGVLVVLLLVVTGCNPFLDRLARTRGEFSLVRVNSSSIPVY